MGSSVDDDSSLDSNSSDSDGTFYGWPSHKKRRRKNDTDSSDHNNTTAMLHACEENNVLPVVDANLICAACNKRVEKPVKHVIQR